MRNVHASVEFKKMKKIIVLVGDTCKNPYF